MEFFPWMEHSILVQFIAFFPCCWYYSFYQLPFLSVVIFLHAHASMPGDLRFIWWSMLGKARVEGNKYPVLTSKFKNAVSLTTPKIVFLFQNLAKRKNLTHRLRSFMLETVCIRNSIVSSLLGEPSRHRAPHSHVIKIIPFFASTPKSLD